MRKKPLKIDMIAGSQLRDTQGEMLSVEGADISDLQNGKGRLNDNHGKGFFNSIGRVTEAKKIFKEEDCENDRHRHYWNKVKAPFIYCAGELYDDEDHQNAKAAAAILRNIHKKDSPLRLKASVEGGVISRGIKDSTLLARTKIHSVALTFTPANQTTLVEPTSLNKSNPEPGDEELIKSVVHLAQENVPSFRHIVRHNSANKVYNNLNKISELVKQIKGEYPDIYIPSAKEILESAIETKITNNISKIHNLIAECNDNDLEKGLKSALASAAAAGLIAGASPAGATDQPQKKSHQQVVHSLKEKNPHLWAIAHVESSGGKDIKHDTIVSDKSMHQGHTAGGPWGLMPNTVHYVSAINSKLRDKYPKVAEMVKDKDSVKENHQKITKFLNNNPKGALDFATALYDRLNKVHGGDKDKIAHSWYHGVKGTIDAIKSGKDIKKHDYVKKFNNLLDHGDKRGNMEKALTAGYGGAAAPTSRTNGAVIQSESLEDDNVKKPTKGFKYVVCDSCGEEQVYSKHQVKCRECGKSWSLEKLFRLME